MASEFESFMISCSAMFTSKFDSSTRQTYTINNIQADIMALILNYAYGCFVEITLENVENLLIASDYLNILGLMRMCCNFLQEEINSRNCIGILSIAETYYCPGLQKQAERFLLYHFPEVAEVSEEFCQLTREELYQLIGKDNLNVKRETVVFESILRWIAHDPENRSSDISLLLPQVRMGFLENEYFFERVRNNVLVQGNMHCTFILIEALKAMYRFRMGGPSLSIPMACPRLPSDILLAVGGWSSGNPTNIIEAYDGRGDRWFNVVLEAESPRAYHGVVFLNGSVYCLGGFNGEEHFNSVRRLDPIRRTWHEVAPMYYRRCYVSVTVLDGYIYAMGGYDGRMRYNTAERYKPETNQWSMIAPMADRRSDASATTLNGKVYICGGFDGHECLLTAECYDPETDQWTSIAPMRSRRSGVGIIAYQEQIFAVGGFDGLHRLRSAEAYSPRNNTWNQVAAMFNPRSNFGIETVDSMLVVVGGFNGFTTTVNVEYYDGESEQWYDAQDMSICRSALSCCVIPQFSNIFENMRVREM